MQAGKYYYMEVYHVNWNPKSIFRLSVEVPNNDAAIKRWQTY